MKELAFLLSGFSFSGVKKMIKTPFMKKTLIISFICEECVMDDSL